MSSVGDRSRRRAWRAPLGIAVALGLLGLQPLAAPPVDPARDIVRLRLVVSTTAASVEIDLENATIANQAVSFVSAPAGARALGSPGAIRLTGNTAGQLLEAECQVILAGVASGSSVAWTIHQLSPGHTHVALYNLNLESTPMFVDRFATDSEDARFETPARALRSRGPLVVWPVASRLVLAHFYPWWDLTSWGSPRLIDRPVQPYSTDDVSDMVRVFQQARWAGLDGLTVSWQGRDYQGGWNDRRMLVALDAAQRVGLKIAALVETAVANPEHSQPAGPADPETVFEWLSDVVDLYSGHPAYLRVGGRPVVFPYFVRAMSPSDWSAVIARLRETGRNPLVIGEDTRSAFLSPIDGEWDYASNRFFVEEIFGFDRDQSVRVRTFHLLGSAYGARRVFAATVSPGYDDTRLTDYTSHRVTDRALGAYYEAQWTAALDSVPDWILITSWNEWYENTGIEPSVLYGDSYLRRTRFWTYLFHSLARPARSSQGKPVVGKARPR